MEKILGTYVSSTELKKFERDYHDKLLVHAVTPDIQFKYSWCLVQSCYLSDVRKGVILLTSLVDFSTYDDDALRDYFFYLACGYTRLKEYNNALADIKKLLDLEPSNYQAKDLQQLILKKRRKERMTKALVGSSVVAVGGIIGASILGSGVLSGAAGAAISRVAPLLLTLARR